jgi:hypothetical protein
MSYKYLTIKLLHIKLASVSARIKTDVIFNVLKISRKIGRLGIWVGKGNFWPPEGSGISFFSCFYDKLPLVIYMIWMVCNREIWEKICYLLYY